MKILSNQRRCTECGAEPFSAHRHDYATCSCGKVMVDGGMSYLRCSPAGEDMYIVITDESYYLLMKAIEDRSKNTLGKLCNVARVLRDHMGINISEEINEHDK